MVRWGLRIWRKNITEVRCLSHITSSQDVTEIHVCLIVGEVNSGYLVPSVFARSLSTVIESSQDPTHFQKQRGRRRYFFFFF